MAVATTMIDLSAGMLLATVVSIALLGLLSWALLAWLGVLPRRR
jgi:hypothetical protein